MRNTFDEFIDFVSRFMCLLLAGKVIDFVSNWRAGQFGIGVN